MSNRQNYTGWKKKSITQQPNWKNKNEFQSVIRQIKNYPTIVFPEEIKQLRNDLIDASYGKSFIIQGGDCAETFADFSAPMIKNKIKILLQMSAIIKYITKLNVINIGRIAGQFAKPRTNQYEKRNNMRLPVYRGDLASWGTRI